MPRCDEGNWKISDNVFGRGSLHGNLLESTFRTRRRAAKINEGVHGRQMMTQTVMEKHQRSVDARNAKVMARVRKTQQELEAYQRVLKSYKVDDFDTMKFGFCAHQVRSPASFRRYQLERRIYNCGFTIDTLNPEVVKVIEMTQPEVKKDERHRKLLHQAARRSNFQIDRRITNEAMRREKLQAIHDPSLAYFEEPEESDLDQEHEAK